jgi:hypothetical protein
LILSTGTSSTKPFWATHNTATWTSTDGAVLGLFEDLTIRFPAFELRLCLRVEVRSELSEGRQFPELGEFEFDAAGDLFHGLDLGGGADAGDGEPTEMAGRMPW